jgi:hypothetical protein
MKITRARTKYENVCIGCMSAIVLMIWSCASIPAYPRVVGGILAGTVTDESGAAIPMAAVSIANVATGVTTNVSANHVLNPAGGAVSNANEPSGINPSTSQPPDEFLNWSMHGSRKSWVISSGMPKRGKRCIFLIDLRSLWRFSRKVTRSLEDTCFTTPFELTANHRGIGSASGPAYPVSLGS